MRRGKSSVILKWVFCLKENRSLNLFESTLRLYFEEAFRRILKFNEVNAN